VEKDYASVYEDRLANHTYLRTQDTHPLNIFYGIRWTDASETTLSHVHGRKGDRYVLIEPIGQHGTGAWGRELNRCPTSVKPERRLM
jgi:hypothetical protein